MNAELQARRTAAAAVLADFRAEAGEINRWRFDSAGWCRRLATHLGYLLEELDRPQPRIDGSVTTSCVMPDGSATLSHADLLTVLGALSTAALCDRDHAVAYRALSRRLGDDRD